MLPDTVLRGDMLIQILLAVILLGQAAKATAWLIGRRGNEDERQAKEQTRQAIATILEQHGRIEQLNKETRAVSTETRELVRGLREDSIRAAQTGDAVVRAIDSLQQAIRGMAQSISELVGEMRADRRRAP
jgi:predicted Ser/Thr protein kinase